MTQNTKYNLNDEFYLMSCKEIFGTNYDVADDSLVLPYYNGATAADRKKYNNGSAAIWRLRTPNSGHAYGVRIVSSDGTVNGYGAFYSNGLVPACTIV